MKIIDRVLGTAALCSLVVIVVGMAMAVDRASLEQLSRKDCLARATAPYQKSVCERIAR